MTETRFQDFEESEFITSEDQKPPLKKSPWSRLSLFWRTFFMLALLLLGSIGAWLQTLRALELEPRTAQFAHQITSQVNLTRAALMYADDIARVSLLKTVSEEEGLRIQIRMPTDTFEPVGPNPMALDVAHELRDHLGQDTVIASSVNQQPGLWIGFDVDGQPYWLATNLDRLYPAGIKTWGVWIGLAALLSLVGAALIARLVNQPLKELSFAASRVRDGDFVASRLSEQVHTSEIREVNIGFNRMAQSLAKVEEDRAVMLAGISHDLRTPLARLRLETEMSVADMVARQHMAADIDQLDAIIDKFLDYARPGSTELQSVALSDVIHRSLYALGDWADVEVQLQLDDSLCVLAEEVELSRVFCNLLENARKYGKSLSTGATQVDVITSAMDKWVLIKIRDHGPGVPQEQLASLTKPFYRGEAARTAANGAGLGLAIVEKTVQRMGGVFLLTASPGGGLSANIKLQRAEDSPSKPLALGPR